MSWYHRSHDEPYQPYTGQLMRLCPATGAPAGAVRAAFGPPDSVRQTGLGETTWVTRVRRADATLTFHFQHDTVRSWAIDLPEHDWQPKDDRFTRWPSLWLVKYWFSLKPDLDETTAYFILRGCLHDGMPLDAAVLVLQGWFVLDYVDDSTAYLRHPRGLDTPELVYEFHHGRLRLPPGPPDARVADSTGQDARR